MAKQKYLTRTMKSTRASILCMDIETAEPMNETGVLAGKYNTDHDILKQAKKQIENDRVKCVAVANSQTETALYRMSEDFFLANAEKVK